MSSKSLEGPADRGASPPSHFDATQPTGLGWVLGVLRQLPQGGPYRMGDGLRDLWACNIVIWTGKGVLGCTAEVEDLLCFYTKGKDANYYRERLQDSFSESVVPRYVVSATEESLGETAREWILAQRISRARARTYPMEGPKGFSKTG